jgi:glutamate-ammonia-ligase adenylyltransferase
MASREATVSRREDLRRAVGELCPGLAVAAIDEYFARMDDAYFAEFDAPSIATHLTLAVEIEPAVPVRLRIEPRQGRRCVITVVGYDHFGEFAVLCGLLASFGLDIRSGHIHTFHPPQRDEGAARRRGGRRASAPSATKIVDVFDVSVPHGVEFDAERQAAFAAELDALVRRLSAGAFEDARDRLNSRLVERLESPTEHFAGVLYPVDVAFEDDVSAGWTVMDVRAQDTPAFLYALANALVMRGIYVHRVEIDSHGGGALSGERQETLRLAVGLIKQFTHFLPSAPEPAAALRAFDQLLDKVLGAHARGEGLSLFTERDGLDMLAHLLGSSRFLWEDFLRMQADNLLPLLRDLRRQVVRYERGQFAALLHERLAAQRTLAGRQRALNETKDREMFLIDLRQLLDPDRPLEEFSAALAALAEAVLEAGCGICAAELAERHGRPRLADGNPCAWALFGLGKLGGRELGYASDVELLFVYGGDGSSDGTQSLENARYFEALVTRLTEVIEARQDGIFHIDLRLRPHGRKGALASVLQQVERYYSVGGDAAPFERQALIKLRWLAGDESLGRRVEALRDAFVYGGAPFDLAAARHLRWRQIQELTTPGQINVKLGAGGLVDVEYAAQYLQIEHGARRSDVRTPNTLEALRALAAHDVLAEEECAGLTAAYRHLRRVMEGLRMVRGNAKDLVLPQEGSEELKFLARRLGRTGESWGEAAAQLVADLKRHMAFAHEFYCRRFGAPQP